MQAAANADPTFARAAPRELDSDGTSEPEGPRMLTRRWFPAQARVFEAKQKSARSDEGLFEGEANET
ncbi:MAG: hypothetical protein JWP87_3078 [Labilithrix sp.]|jgi:hypothetical protein|nr:hypothetical protein [Labilithrix sp.]